MVPSMFPLIISLVAGAAIVFTPSSASVASCSRERLVRWLAIPGRLRTGGLLGGAFPSPSWGGRAGGPIFPMALVGALGVFLLDSLLLIYHCHGGHRLHVGHDNAHGSRPPSRWVGSILMGDAVHNLVDGVAIVCFLADTSLGISTASPWRCMRSPRVGDFGILVHFRFRPKGILQERHRCMRSSRCVGLERVRFRPDRHVRPSVHGGRLPTWPATNFL